MMRRYVWVMWVVGVCLFVPTLAGAMEAEPEPGSDAHWIARRAEIVQAFDTEYKKVSESAGVQKEIIDGFYNGMVENDRQLKAMSSESKRAGLHQSALLFAKNLFAAGNGQRPSKRETAFQTKIKRIQRAYESEISRINSIINNNEYTSIKKTLGLQQILDRVRSLTKDNAVGQAVVLMELAKKLLLFSDAIRGTISAGGGSE